MGRKLKRVWQCLVFLLGASILGYLHPHEALALFMMGWAMLSIWCDYVKHHDT